MSSKRMRKSRFERLNKIKKRRCNFFALEQKVKELEEEARLLRASLSIQGKCIDTLQTSQIMSVKTLLSLEETAQESQTERLNLKQTPKATFWAWIKQTLSNKGEP